MHNDIQPLPTTGTCERATSPSLDVLFDILGNERRRGVLSVLADRGELTTLREVTAAVAARENGVPEDELSYRQRKRVRTSLYQVHLPRMREAGAIDYDADRGTLALNSTSRVFLASLDGNGHRSPRWPLVYVALGSAGVLTVLLALGELLPPSLGSLPIATAISLALLLVSGLHVFSAH